MAWATNFDIVFGELLSQILSHSPTSELIEYRLVSQQWKYEATRILLERGDLKIQFELTSSPPLGKNSTFYSFKPGDRRYCSMTLFKLMKDLLVDRTLTSLSQLVTSPPHKIPSSLPVCHFDFRFQFFGMNHPQLSSFLLIHGPVITTLTLDNYVFYFDSRNGLTDSILQYTPNIESLYIRQTYRRKDTPRQVTSEQTNNVSLPRLKAIEIYHEPKNRRQTYKTIYALIFGILPHLLETAPQLERISFPSYFNPNFLKPFLRSKINFLRIGTLYLEAKDLFFESLEMLEVFVKVMMKSPQGIGLRHLRICVDAWPLSTDSWKRGSSAIRSILAKNAKSLHEITLISGAALILHRIPGLPVLTKVVKLFVSLNEHGSFVDETNPDEILDFVTEFDDTFPGNSLSGLFPNLEAVDLLNWPWEDEETDQKWFPFWNDKLIRVKSLRAKSNNNLSSPNPGPGKITSSYVLSLKLCPEVESFTTYWPLHDFALLFQPLWNMTQLTSLHLLFQHGWPGWDKETDLFIEVDAALTGMPKDLVLSIYNNWKRCGRWKKLNNEEAGRLLENNSPLLSLQNLRKLHLEIRCMAGDKPKTFISGVSAKFAFDIMPHLEVLLVFDFFGPSSFCVCDVNYVPDESTRQEWLNLHSPLSSLPNVTVGLKEDMPCCIINDPDGHCDFE